MKDRRLFASGEDSAGVGEPEDAEITWQEQGDLREEDTELGVAIQRGVSGKALLVPATHRRRATDECRIEEGKRPPYLFAADAQHQRRREEARTRDVGRELRLQRSVRARHTPCRRIEIASRAHENAARRVFDPIARVDRELESCSHFAERSRAVSAYSPREQARITLGHHATNRRADANATLPA